MILLSFNKYFVEVPGKGWLKLEEEEGLRNKFCYVCHCLVSRTNLCAYL